VIPLYNQLEIMGTLLPNLFFMGISGLFMPFLCLPGDILRQPGDGPEKIREGSVGRKEEEGCQPFDKRI